VIRAYKDEGIAEELGGGFGAYLGSYASPSGIEIHLFKGEEDGVTAYVVKPPGESVSASHSVIIEALNAGGLARCSKIVYDPNGIGRR
jgi:hypothetical protein